MKSAKAGKGFLMGIAVIWMLLCMTIPSEAKERRVVRVGYPEQYGFTMKDEKGQYSGYTYDYLQELAQYTQWEYEFVEIEGALNDSLSVMLDMLKNGEIDLMGGMNYNEALGEIFDYPGSAYGETGIVLAVPDSNLDMTPESFTEREILRVAVVGNGGKQQDAMERYLNSICQNYEIISCIDGNEAVKMVQEKKADVILEPEVGTLDGYRAVAKFSSTPFYMAVTKGNTELLKELNAGMLELEETNPTLIPRLHRKYFNEKSEYLLYETREKTYLEQAGTLKVAVLDGKVPIQSVNPKTGEAQGIAVDFLNYISKETGLRFEYIGIKDTDEYRRMVLDKEVDLILAVPGSALVTEKFGIAQTLPYMNVSQILIVHKGVDPGELKGKTAAVYDAFGSVEPEAGQVKLYYSPEEAMEAVNKGEADYSHINNYSFQYCINKTAYKNITAIVMTESGSQPICLGVVRDSDRVLHNILNKVISYMPDSEKERIFYESSINREQLSFMDYVRENPGAFTAAALVLVAAIGLGLLRNIRNRYEMDRKMALEYRRYRQLSEVVGESVYEYDFRDDVLRFSGDGVRKLGVDEVIGDFSKYGVELLKKQGISGENTLYHWIMQEEEGTRDVQIISAREPERWYRVTSKVVKDDSGRAVYSIGRVWDIQKEKIEKERLLRKAQNDGMTGIYNSSTVREVISEALLKEKTGGALLIMDIDHFKEINDHYGHSIGDDVLTQVGACMKSIFAKDIYGRLGGDEFIAYMPGVRTEEELQEKAETIRNEFRKIVIVPALSGITASIGVVVRKDETDFEVLYQKADILLYEVKKEGRDGCKIG